VAAASEIAAVDGVDVLFVGPLDLSVNLGCPGDFQDSKVIDACRDVVAACEHHGKTAGILAKGDSVQAMKDLGFRFLALGSDSGAVLEAMETNLKKLQ